MGWKGRRGLTRTGRYDVSGLVEAQYEPGSRGRVLKNLLGIQRVKEIGKVEAREYIRTLEELIRVYTKDHRFKSADIRAMHARWLRPIYGWAGRYRRVNLSRDNFPFAAAREIPKLMAEFEEGPLRKFTPCRPGSNSEIMHAIAIVHVELILIHPFRDGNGRVARLLSRLMALQAGMPPLDYRGIHGKGRRQYFEAVRAGIAGDYVPMERVFDAVIRRTFRAANGP